ncbi:MAG: two-component system sensor histidine kinase/response regulator [Candidatus Omnitrophota bacterium]|jgi:two-component system sensor histidine kinase/response regulator
MEILRVLLICSDSARESFYSDTLLKIKYCRFEIQTVNSHVTASQYLATQKTDLILHEIDASEVDPVASYRHMQSLSTRTSVIAILSGTHAHHVEGIIEAGAIDCLLAEQLDLELLRRCIRHAVGIKQIRSEQVDTEAKYRGIFENSGVAIMVADAAERIVSWNPFVEKILRMGFDDLQNKPVQDLYSEAEWQSIRSKKMRERGGHESIESKVIRSDGAEIDVDLAITVIKNDVGEVTGTIGIMRDITLRKKAEAGLHLAKEEAEQANLAKSEFLANMSHELRTPMNAVIGFSELLNDTSMDETQQDYVHTITDSARILLDLINDVLDFSKIEANRIELENVEFDLAYLVQSSLKIVQTKLHSDEVSLGAEFENQERVKFMGDPTRIRQILMNLLSNAVKFTKKGSICVKVKSSPDKNGLERITLNVHDSGIGIAEEKFEKIFEPFSQADSSTTKSYGGTGLGLPIISALAEQMGGSIRVESTHGEGSVFKVELYLKAVEAKPNSTQAHLTMKSVNLGVLGMNLNEKTQLAKLEQCNLIKKIVYCNSSSELLKSEAENALSFDVILVADAFDKIDPQAELDYINAQWTERKPKTIILAQGPEPGYAKKFADMGYDAFLPFEATGKEVESVFEALVSGSIKGQIVTRHNTEEQKVVETKAVHILVAEDNPINRKLIGLVLKKNGYDADFAENGQEAVELAKDLSFDICLMDLQMPIMGGVDAAVKILADVNPNLPIIALTAAATNDDRDNALNAGMKEFLTKPLDIKKLKAALEKWS